MQIPELMYGTVYQTDKIYVLKYIQLFNSKFLLFHIQNAYTDVKKFILQVIKQPILNVCNNFAMKWNCRFVFKFKDSLTVYELRLCSKFKLNNWSLELKCLRTI